MVIPTPNSMSIPGSVWLQRRNTKKDEEHNRACPVSARVLVTVTESNDSQTVVIDGYRYEDDYTTRVFTLGDGIVNKRGVIRVEVYRADYLAGWREVNIER